LAGREHGALQGGQSGLRRRYEAARRGSLLPSPLRGGDGGGGIYRKRGLNFASHTFDIADHVVIPESQNSKTLLTQVSVARGSHPLTGSRIMLTAIDLNNKSRKITGEVDNEMINRYLPTEMETLRFQRTKESPKLSFGIG